MIGKKRLLIFAGVFLFVGLASYARAQERARAEIKNAEGKSLGTAGLRQTKGGVVIALRLTALPPGLHAVHIHSAGKCEAPGFTSAGGHFNPLNMEHGLRNTDGPHAGDLPDLYVNKDGVGRYEVLVQSISLGAGKLSSLTRTARRSSSMQLPTTTSRIPRATPETALLAESFY